MTVGLPKYDFLYDNSTFPLTSIRGLRDINKYTILFSAYANFTVNEVYNPCIQEVPVVYKIGKQTDENSR